MSLLKLDEFNIVCIYVENLEESLKFYTEVLGFEKDFDNGPGVCLKIENVVSIYLEGGYHKTNPEEKKASVSFCVHPAGGLRDAWEKISKAGIKTLGGYEEYGETFAMFRLVDPSGNLIEFAGKP